MDDLPIMPAMIRSLSEDVTESLREAILRGLLKPEQHLREEQIANALKVSRVPVRSALMQLEHEGLVIARRNRGYIVARLSREDLEEVYALRLALERLAVQYAIHKATDQDFEAMAEVVRAFEDTANREISEREAADLDIKYHDLLYQAAHHKQLLKHWQTLRAQTYIFLLSRNVASPGFRELMINSHAILLAALRDRDEVRAVALIEEHMRWAYVRIVEGYDVPNASTPEPTELIPILNPKPQRR
ncbi:MAG: GntR family transcriptional regulator [Anaerolineae bacterium]|nr:GntR family transcriptional regulator [Anaerolineae bacterium]